jgi:hypothetical protein
LLAHRYLHNSTDHHPAVTGTSALRLASHRPRVCNPITAESKESAVCSAMGAPSGRRRDSLRWPLLTEPASHALRGWRSIPGVTSHVWAAESGVITVCLWSARRCKPAPGRSSVAACASRSGRKPEGAQSPPKRPRGDLAESARARRHDGRSGAIRAGKLMVQEAADMDTW